MRFDELTEEAKQLARENITKRLEKAVEEEWRRRHANAGK